MYKTATFDGDTVQQTMHSFVAEHECALRQVSEQFQSCTVFFTIYVAVHQDGEYPSIRLKPYFLQDACQLNASVDIVLDNDYAVGETSTGNDAARTAFSITQHSHR